MRDVCLFAHFDKDNRVDDYVLHYIRSLRQLNFSIIFISATRIGPADVARLSADCDDVMLRENAGLDFGSWSAGFQKHGAAIEGRLLLANDSVYGPVGSLQLALARLTATAADFYGFVESMEVTPHLQSWFLLFESAVVRHAAFRQIMEQPFRTMSKKQIIARGEVALSSRLLDAGFRYRALCDRSRPVFTPPRHAMNPMLLFWREMLVDCGIPFLKIELLRDNPLGIEDAAAILHGGGTDRPGGVRNYRGHIWRERLVWRPCGVHVDDGLTGCDTCSFANITTSATSTVRRRRRRLP